MQKGVKRKIVLTKTGVKKKCEKVVKKICKKKNCEKKKDWKKGVNKIV